MRYAQILKGIVMNIIQLDDPSFIPKFLEGFDDVVLIDKGLDPQPDIGWLWDGKVFSAPVPVQEDFKSELLKLLIDRANAISNQKASVNALDPGTRQELVKIAEISSNTIGDPDVDQALNNIINNKF